MWCHLCKKDYEAHEDFKVHILKVHRCASEFYTASTDSEESKDDIVEVSEIDENSGNRSDHISDQETAKHASDAGSEDFSSKSELSCTTKISGRKKKYALRKKTLPRRKKSVISYQEDSSEHSDDVSTHSQNSIKRNDEKANTNSVVNNNQLYFINPYVGQAMNNYILGSQSVQQPVYVINPSAAKFDNENSFDFSSKNILKWLAKHKELCRNIKFPLPSSLFDQIRTVHRGIFDHYCMASSGEETSAVMKVYEELNNMIYKHLSQINEEL